VCWPRRTRYPSPASPAPLSLRRLEVRPHLLHGVELGRVGRQGLDPEPMCMVGDVRTHQLAAMGGEAIPDHRHPLPVHVIGDDGCASSRRPGGADRRLLGEPTLVHGYHGPAATQSPLFSRGQSSRTQFAIRSSSRSLARRAGRWRVHPIFRSSFHTWQSEYSIPNSRRITAPTRGQVHRSVAYPWARGPRRSSCPDRSSCFSNSDWLDGLSASACPMSITTSQTTVVPFCSPSHLRRTH